MTWKLLGTSGRPPVREKNSSAAEIEQRDCEAAEREGFTAVVLLPRIREKIAAAKLAEARDAESSDAIERLENEKDTIVAEHVEDCGPIRSDSAN